MSKLHCCHFLSLKHISPLSWRLVSFVKVYCHLEGGHETGLLRVFAFFSVSDPHTPISTLTGRQSRGEVHLF